MQTPSILNAPETPIQLPADLPGAHALLTRFHGDKLVLESQVLDLRGELQQARWQIDQLKKKLFGPTSERQVSDTLSKEQILMGLFPPPSEPPATQDVVLPETPAAPTEEKKKRRAPRQPQTRELEVVITRIEPPSTACDSCHEAGRQLRIEKSEYFDYQPARIIRHEVHRPVYAHNCACDAPKMVIAPLPPMPVEKGMPSPGLLAHVALSKYADHLPLYRQQQQFARLGVNFPRALLADWMTKTAGWLQPLVREMKTGLLAGDYLQVDETPVKVMDPEVKGRCAIGWLWVAGVPGGDVIFEFHPGRGKVFAAELVGDFEGYLQRDGYGVYQSLARDNPGLIPVGCWAHARRYFVDALDDEPVQAKWFVEEIRKLYLIEAHAREKALSPDDRLTLRKDLSAPVLTAIKARMDEIEMALLPQSPLGKACRYARAEWTPLTRCLENGRLEIDNNLTENAIRPSAVGKKNWLFIGHPEAGWRSAVIYSVIASCRRRKIDPWEYLRDVLTRLPSATTSQLPDLVPARWRPAA